eukprot:3392191-Rhodomonas_salina.2
MLLTAGADVNHADPRGKTALHHAAENGRLQCIEALHMAASQGHTQTVKVLLAEGADVNVRDKQGRTPLLVCK